MLRSGDPQPASFSRAPAEGWSRSLEPPDRATGRNPRSGAVARGAEVGEEALEGGGERGREFKPRAGDRVSEAQGGGVKREAVEVPHKAAKLGILKSPCDATAAVGFIADHGEAEVGEVDANLMGPPRAEPGFKEGEAVKGFQHCEVGDGSFPLPNRSHRHAEAVARVASDRGFDHPLTVRKPAVDESEILSLDAPRFELSREGPMGPVRFRDNQEARGPPIKTMHNPGTSDSADARKVRAMVEKRVNQSSGRVTRPGVDHEASRLHDNQQVLVFINHIERDRFGAEIEGDGGRDSESDHLAGPEGPAGLWPEAGHLDFTGSDQGLKATPGEVRTPTGKEAIDPEPGLLA